MVCNFFKTNAARKLPTTQSKPQLSKVLTVLAGLGCTLFLASCGVNTNAGSNRLYKYSNSNLSSNRNYNSPNSDVMFGGSYSSNNGRVVNNTSNPPTSANTKGNDYNRPSVVTTTSTYPDGVRITRTVTFHPVSNSQDPNSTARNQQVNNSNSRPYSSPSSVNNYSSANNYANNNYNTSNPNTYANRIQSCLNKFHVSTVDPEEMQDLLSKCYPNNSINSGDKVEFTSTKNIYPSDLGPQRFPYLIAPGNNNLFTDSFSFDVPLGFNPANRSNPSYFSFQPSQLNLTEQLQIAQSQSKYSHSRSSEISRINQLTAALRQVDNLDLYVNTTSYDGIDYRFLSDPDNRAQALIYFNRVFTKDHFGSHVTCSIFYNLPNYNATYVRCSAYNPNQGASYTYGVVAIPKHDANMFYFSLNATYFTEPNATTIDLIDGYADYIASHIQ